MLTADGKRLLTLDELLVKHPGLRTHDHDLAYRAHQVHERYILAVSGHRIKEKVKIYM